MTLALPAICSSTTQPGCSPRTATRRLAYRRSREAAGVTKPTLYHHFGNKRGLLDALLREQFAALAVKATEAAAYRHDVTGTLRAVAATYFGWAAEHPEFYRLMLRLWFCPPSGDEHAASGHLFAFQQTLLEQLFQRAARDHGNMKGRHVAYAATFLGMINTYVGIHLNGQGRLDHKLIDQAIHQYMHGIFS